MHNANVKYVSKMVKSLFVSEALFNIDMPTIT